MAEESYASRNRETLLRAQAEGGWSVLGAYVRLSGPGWLQSAITLGSGSLTGALFLGVLGGTSMLWLQLVAIVMGVIMLSAISYVTLSTGKRPFQAINEYVNPVLGCGWLLATCTANMIWSMPQFSVAFAALDKNLVPGGLISAETPPDAAYWIKLKISGLMLVVAIIVVALSEGGGPAAKLFDYLLKALVGMIVLCFFGVVIVLAWRQGLPWGEIFSGFIPRLSQWNEPTGQVARILSEAPEAYREFWRKQIVDSQRNVMIGAAATAVGINMTFLLPYSMLSRGWDKPFRGLARFDLATGMAIPYILVTSCVVIASAYNFHGKVDEDFLSQDPQVMTQSPTWDGAQATLAKREQVELGESAWQELSEAEQQARIAALPASEKQLAATLVKRNAFQLAKSLEPLLGARWANQVFGLGVLGMGFSSIIILMLINGYVFRELAPEGAKQTFQYLGYLVAGATGALWPLIWEGDSKFWLAILTSTFGMMLLPIAYITFFFMMNNRRLLGDEKPTGLSMWIWNILMGISVVGSIVAAWSAISTKISDPVAGPTVVGIALVFGLLTLVGFAAR
ncbi:MAG: divalent metal cation transporter, partial [Planctomycetota bacterium]